MKHLDGLRNAAKQIIFDVRCIVGMWLFDLMLSAFPPGFTIPKGILRGVKEQIEFDRYEGYCLLCGAKPMPFDNWRRLREYELTPRPARKCNVRDTSHLHVIRERHA